MPAPPPRHTIVLLQTGRAKDSRTFLDFPSVKEALEGVCRIYESRLRQLNPGLQSLTYDVNDLFAYIDSLPDLSALAFEHSCQAYEPWGKEQIKKRLVQHLRGQATQ